MSLILARRANVYAGSPLQRAAERREDAEWIGRALSDPQSLFVPVWRSRSLVSGADGGGPVEAIYLTGEAARAVHAAGGPWCFLGLLAERPVFAVDMSEADDPLPMLPAGLGSFVDLRAVGGGRLAQTDASVLAHARGLMHGAPRRDFAASAAAAASRTAPGTCCGAQGAGRSISRAPIPPSSC